MQLHPVDREGAPPYPRGSRKARRLRNLPRMENFQERRVYKQGFRLAYQLREDLPPQRFQEAPELSHPPVQRGRVKPRYAREQVRKEPLGVAQERAFALYPSELLEEREGDDLGVRKPLYGLVLSRTGVEQRIGVIYEAEEHGESLFQVAERVGVCWGRAIRGSFREGSDGPVVPSIHATII